MRILYYDCFSGISGDMNLGAMINLGVSRDYLTDNLKKLNIDGWRLDITIDQRHGISGTKVTVVTDEGNTTLQGHSHMHDHENRHEHKHDHEHDHEHEEGNNNTGNAPHGSIKQRNLSDIEEIITRSQLSPKVSSLALKIFRRIAEAEAAVHDKPLNEIHFHEVGAVDSIIDIVGAAICLDALGADRVYVSVIELGSGMVRCEHGLLPVPAPATARIISGYPVHTGGVDFEATTPTGAAIIAAVAEPLPRDMTFVIEKSGYGIGQKLNPSRPNLLRVCLAQTTAQERPGHQAYLIECNVDDMNPETTEYIMAKLFAAGAGDAWITPVIMKKSRPALTLSVICEEDRKENISEILFTESTTIGLRVTPFSKETLHREFEEIDTDYGKVMIKKSYFNSRLVSVKPEADRCAEIAAKTGLPMKQVMQEITTLAQKKS
jgi:uncharacterized protein (TIGR00299 family) protein